MKKELTRNGRAPALKRCAIYTRKSVEEGLDMEYNTLDAQRDAGESYIASQRCNGWTCLPDRYDDGGFSGGNVNRPALGRLIQDIETGRIDVVVVYKIDRLSRSILDFAELMKKFDQFGVSFCAVTQDINTATSSGRMMLNILVTFAQYEREVIAERIRDKFAASKKKGMWMGGVVPMGYRVMERKLVVVPEEAEIVRRIFRRYVETQSPLLIVRELNGEGIKKKNGGEWKVGALNTILHNSVYIGKVHHGDEDYDGEHEAIVDEDVWRKAQEFMANVAAQHRTGDLTRNSAHVAPLKGILECGCCNGTMIPYSKTKDGVTYSYYRCSKDALRPIHTCPIRQITAQTIEDAVFAKLAAFFRTPSLLRELSEMTGYGASKLSRVFGGEFWEHITSSEKQRLCELLLERVVLHEDRMEIEIRTNGFTAAMEEIENEDN